MGISAVSPAVIFAAVEAVGAGSQFKLAFNWLSVEYFANFPLEEFGVGVKG